MSASAPGADHDLGDLEPGETLTPVEDNPIWQQENVTLSSVGIDVGSSGTQLLFSRLRLRRSGSELATRFHVVERITTYQSPVAFTPFDASGLIDGQALGALIDGAYAAARLRPEEIDTGVVILTGEALKRENAEQIATVIALKAGELVCAAAGHHMEARLAAYGSGAVRRSGETGERLLNIDIGGGTTKLSLVEAGEVLQTAALELGGRLIAVDREERLVRLEDGGRRLAERAGLELRIGERLARSDRRLVAEAMADLLAAALSPGAQPARSSGVPWLTEPIGALDGVHGAVFSGGVSEYLYGLEEQDFGDLGRDLAAGIASRLRERKIALRLLPAAACIRATVLGASQFSVQVSGNTYYASSRATLLPRRNARVLRPAYELGQQIDPARIAASIRRHLEDFVPSGSNEDVVLALSWCGEVCHARLHAFARGISAGLAARSTLGLPMLLAIDADIGKSLGHLLRGELGVEVETLVLDGLRLLDFDFVDLGTAQEPSGVVPVTIKSLVF